MNNSFKIETITTPKCYKSKYADEYQKEVYKKMPKGHFLSDERNMHHFLMWNTFFRRNLHRFATDFLEINLFLYQIILLYFMGVCTRIVIIASRCSAKSFLIGLYVVIRAILYPRSSIVLSAQFRRQSGLIITEKIKKELMSISPMLWREIKNIKEDISKLEVEFYNGSTIKVVTDKDRGVRSNVCVREEFRLIKKRVEDQILAPFQYVRQPPYIINKELPYHEMPELIEEPVDIYISSSWYDDGSSWIWKIVDGTYEGIQKGKPYCLFAFDESIALKHKLKTMNYFIGEKKKQDPDTWNIEFLNVRLKENISSFFNSGLFKRNQNCKLPFYPRNDLDVRTHKINPYEIPKQKGEIRIISCDLAFIKNDKNDNSVFTCTRFLPEQKVYKNSGDNSQTVVNTGYRRVFPYSEPHKGKELRLQAIRIRQLFNDFNADYIVLDGRNAGVGVYDLLARTLYDEERGVEYAPLTAMNNTGFAERITVEGAEERIFIINASQKLNSDIALGFRRTLAEGKADFLVNLSEAMEDILPNMPEYTTAEDGETQAIYEIPFLSTQRLISESISLVYEKKADTGIVVVQEVGDNTKDFYTSFSYADYFGSKLERDLLNNQEEYSYNVFIN